MKVKLFNKKVFSIILSVIMLISVIPVGAVTASAATSGYYTYSVSNGKATITDCRTSISGDIIIPSELGDYSVTSIGDEAFYRCSSLTSITIPNSVTSIGYNAFRDCSKLTSVTIPNSVTSIGYRAFYCCSGLTNIIISNSVNSIGDEAFGGCSSLTSIIVDKNNTTYDSRNGCNAVIETKTNKLIVGCNNTVIPNSVTSIGDCAFYKCSSLTSITIPNSVTSIGEAAFEYCISLRSITIPGSVKSIGDCAFEICNKLTSITIPNSVTSIGNCAFEYCSSLTSITIPNSVTSIGEGAFSDCYSLTRVTIPNSVTSIGDGTFAGCNSLTSVTIPNSVTSIGVWAFYECVSLTDVYYGGNEEDWNKISIDSNNGCLSSAKIHYNGNHIPVYDSGKIIVPPTCTSTGTIEYTCTVCGDTYTEDIPASGHMWGAWISAGDQKTHTKECSVCGLVETSDCTYEIISNKAPTCISDGYKVCACSVCHDTYTEDIPELGHTWSDWTSNGDCTTHKRTCSVCNTTETENCTYTVTDSKDATCTEDGYKTYTCSVCGDTYTEEISAMGHSWSDWTSNGDHETHTRNCTACEDSQTEACAYETTDSKPATINVNGYITYTCSDCDDKKSSTIYYPKTFKLSTTSYTYDGKTKTPAVSIKDSAGKTISSANYTVTYASGRKYVGKYAVKVTFKGNYSGSKMLYFNINPRNTSISKLASAKKSFKVYLKKYTTQTTGYQIQYSTSSKFTGAKTVTVSNKTTAKTISKLYGGKRYYVRCRTYKKVGKTNFFSSWSGAKAITTKR